MSEIIDPKSGDFSSLSPEPTQAENQADPAAEATSGGLASLGDFGGGNGFLQLDLLLENLEKQLQQDWLVYRLHNETWLRGRNHGNWSKPELEKKVKQTLQPLAQVETLVQPSGQPIFRAKLQVPKAGLNTFQRWLEKRLGKPFLEGAPIGPKPAANAPILPAIEGPDLELSFSSAAPPVPTEASAPAPIAKPAPRPPISTPIQPTTAGSSGSFFPVVLVQVLGMEFQNGQAWLHVQEPGWNPGKLILKGEATPPERGSTLQVRRISNAKDAPRYLL